MFRIHESGSVSGSWVPTESKNTNFVEIGGTKNVHGPKSRGTSRTQRPSTKIFFKGVIHWKFGVFWKACIVPFQKSNICPNKFLETLELFKKIHFRSFNFQQISTLEPNLTMKFDKICGEILVVKSTTHKVSETLFCVKIYPLELEISSILCQKTCEIGWKNDMDFSRFHTFFDIKLMISSVPVNRFWCNIAFWKRH